MLNESTFLAAITEGDDTARLAFADWLEEHDDPRAPWVRDEAIFAWMLPDARDPLPALLKALAEGDSHGSEAAAILPRVNNPAVAPALVALVEVCADSHGAGYFAAQALSKMGSAVEPFAPRLVELILSQPEASVPAATALSAVPSFARQVVPVLIARLERDHDWDIVDNETIYLLQVLGPASIDAVPALVDRLHCWDSDAGLALAAIGPDATKMLLQQAARLDDDFMVRAIWPLRSYGPAALEPLREALNDESEAVRALAAMALAPLDPVAAFPHLLEASGDWHRNDYDSALARAFEDASAAAIKFLPEIRRRFPSPRGEVAATLRAIVDRLDADAALAEMCPMLEAIDPARACQILRAIATMPYLTPQIVTTVVALLATPDSTVRKLAVDVASGWKLSEMDTSALIIALRRIDRDVLSRVARQRAKTLQPLLALVREALSGHFPR